MNLQLIIVQFSRKVSEKS